MDLCGTHLPENTKEVHAKRELLCKGSRAIDEGQYLYFSVAYYVVYNSESENVSLERLQEQHNVINNDFNALNSDIVRVPSVGTYAFASIIGDAKIRMLPLLGSELTEKDITRIQSNNVPSGGFTGVDQIQRFINANTELNVPLDGILNVYIGPLQGSLLGQAELFSNICVIRNETVGGPSVPGSSTLQNYNFGRTATHEIGHCMGLPHTFSQTGTCPSERVFADIPKQKRPNFDAFLIEENGSWTGKLDNRFRDCNIPLYDIPGESPPYSCMDDTVDTCINGKYEMFMNYMDYGNDLSSICFSQDQVSAVRQFLLSGSVYNLQDGPDIPPTPSNTTVPPVPPTVENDTLTETSSGLQPWLIALIIILSILVLGIIIGAILWARSQK